MQTKEHVEIPEGIAFIDLIFAQANTCVTATREQCMNLGTKAPACLTGLGRMLSLLDRLASCSWRCNGGDHTIEYLIGRVVSSARASLQLAFGGFYDESLSLTRSAGEIANLLTLFIVDRPSLVVWKTSDKQGRMNSFGPGVVRRRLRQLGAPLPIDDCRYSTLCEMATHVTPQTLPQGHNPLLIPTHGTVYQEGGYLLALNELAYATMFVALFGATLLKPDKGVRDEIAAATKEVAESIVAVNIVDGLPRLTSSAIKDLHRLLKNSLPEDQRLFQSLIFANLNRNSDERKR